MESAAVLSSPQVLPKEDAAMRIKMGTSVPKMGTTVHLAADQEAYPKAIADALRR